MSRVNIPIPIHHQSLESAIIPSNTLDAILKRHGLIANWEQFGEDRQPAEPYLRLAASPPTELPEEISCYSNDWA
ncbi:MAG TPA: hypothetical protein VMP11_06920 [Verrucomicrobiae bacterium]|nr:hypothetical protein [Verrucomicrobiae bacterium]